MGKPCIGDIWEYRNHARLEKHYFLVHAIKQEYGQTRYYLRGLNVEQDNAWSGLDIPDVWRKIA